MTLMIMEPNQLFNLHNYAIHEGYKFDAILIAGARARELQRGHALKTPATAIKVTVQALEEVAAGVLDATEYIAKVR